MPTGDIKKLSVAVLVDGPYVKNDKGAEEFQPRSKKELADLEELVKKAAGFDAKRGDQVIITNIPFNRADLEAGAGKETWQEKITVFYPVFYPIMKYVVMIVGLLLVIIAVKPLINMLMTRGKMQEYASREAIAPTAGELEGPATSVALGEKTTGAETDLVRQMASADARRFAELLRIWLR